MISFLVASGTITKLLFRDFFFIEKVLEISHYDQDLNIGCDDKNLKNLKN